MDHQKVPQRMKPLASELRVDVDDLNERLEVKGAMRLRHNQIAPDEAPRSDRGAPPAPKPGGMTWLWIIIKVPKG